MLSSLFYLSNSKQEVWLAHFALTSGSQTLVHSPAVSKILGVFKIQTLKSKTRCMESESSAGQSLASPPDDLDEQIWKSLK